MMIVIKWSGDDDSGQVIWCSGDDVNDMLMMTMLLLMMTVTVTMTVQRVMVI